MTDHARLLIDELRDLLVDIDRDHRVVAHWMNAQRVHHAGAVSYDGGAGSSGDVRDLSLVVLRPDPGTRAAKRYLRALKAAALALREADSIRRAHLTTTNDAGYRGDDPAMWCRGHLEAGSREPRSTGDECRACADFRRTMKRRPTPEEIDLRSRTGRWPRNTQVVA